MLVRYNFRKQKRDRKTVEKILKYKDLRKN
jgi:hypothetical protein